MFAAVHAITFDSRRRPMTLRAGHFRQSIDLFQHARALLLVVGRLNHVRRDHQEVLGRHHRLRVVSNPTNVSLP